MIIDNIIIDNLLTELAACLTVFFSVLVITAKNPVAAVTFLIGVFVSAAAYLVLIGINYLGITYLILYVGAIVVLFLFVIMMINIKISDIVDTAEEYTQSIPLALAVGAVFLYELFCILPYTYNDLSFISLFYKLVLKTNSLLISPEYSKIALFSNPFLPSIPESFFANFSQIQTIGIEMYTTAAILLVLISLILLFAMITPLIVAKKNKN